MSSARERAEDIRHRLIEDMTITVMDHVGFYVDDQELLDSLIRRLSEDAMFQVEKLLTEVTW